MRASRTAREAKSQWGGGGLGRGAVPQRLLGSSPCHCVTSSKLAIKTAANTTKEQNVQSVCEEMKVLCNKKQLLMTY